MKNPDQIPMREKGITKWDGGSKKAFKPGLRRNVRHKARIAANETKKLPDEAL